jgi:hypothetical protein
MENSFITITKTNASGFVDVPGDPLAAVAEDGEDAEQFSNYLETVFDGATWSVDVEFIHNVPVYPEPIPTGDPETEPPAFEPEECVDFRTSLDWNEFSINFTKLNNTEFRLAGPSANMFPDEFYKFKMSDYTEQVLPPSVGDPFFSLIEYNMPQPVSVLKDFDFEVLVPKHTISPPSTNWNMWFNQLTSSYGMRYTNSSNNVVVENFSTISALQTRYNTLNLPFENWSSDSKIEITINQWYFWRFQTAVNNIAALVAKGLK